MITERALQAYLAFARTLAEEAGALIRERLLKLEAGEALQIGTKSGPSDLVTEVDRAVEAHVVRRIRAAYPDHGVLGEEGTDAAGSPEAAGLRWVIDPIDGTTNFVHQKVNFCVSIALYAGDEGLVGVVYDPMREERFTAVRGGGAAINGRPLRLDGAKGLSESLIGTSLTWVRRARQTGLVEPVWRLAERSRGLRSLGAAALEAAYVAAGRLDAFLSLTLSPWDFAAAKLIVEEAGGTVVDFAGRPVGLKRPELGFLAAHPSLVEPILEVLRPWALSQQEAR
ncbi:inositol monophosphatase [Hydrogenibacillus sp. N12]|uniref:inositol monophosphatase family protein n=1 Tax=Hydrogenibacillus sp. N12 TaxID=2866627 RepID=UPI001C7D16DB|nr:inositol monophosphatase [Hydrogenibacillus sp. N12]QZA32507.1 inositol monophosphatase [Hydrogenibacillus sp. N12]